jgi:thiol:disulfide interchange protein
MSGPAKLLAVIVGAILLAGAFSAWTRHAASGKERVPWRKDYPAAQTEAAESSRPMLVYFTASWCGPCRWMSEKTWSDARVGAALDGYVPVKIDVDQDPRVAQQYGVSSIPRMLVVGTDGRILRDETGALAPDDFLEWLKR